MDALKLKLRAKDQLHPLLTELMQSYARFSRSNDWAGRPKILNWLIELNQLKGASDEISDEQARQVRTRGVLFSRVVSLFKKTLPLGADALSGPLSCARALLSTTDAIRYRARLCRVSPTSTRPSLLSVSLSLSRYFSRQTESSSEPRMKGD